MCPWPGPCSHVLCGLLRSEVISSVINDNDDDTDVVCDVTAESCNHCDDRTQCNWVINFHISISYLHNHTICNLCSEMRVELLWIAGSWGREIEVLFWQKMFSLVFLFVFSQWSLLLYQDLRESVLPQQSCLLSD